MQESKTVSPRADQGVVALRLEAIQNTRPAPLRMQRLSILLGQTHNVMFMYCMLEKGPFIAFHHTKVSRRDRESNERNGNVSS